jgi:hypothetical protein
MAAIKVIKSIPVPSRMSFSRTGGRLMRPMIERATLRTTVIENISSERLPTRVTATKPDDLKMRLLDGK